MNNVASLQILFSFLVPFLNIAFLLSYLWFLFRENWRSHQLEKSILIIWTLKQLLQIIPTEKTYLKKIFSKVSFPRRLEISAQLDFAFFFFFCACVHVLFHLFNLIELMNAIYWTCNRKSNTTGSYWFFERTCWIRSCKTLVTLSGNWLCLIAHIGPSFKLNLTWFNAKFKL